MSPDTPLDPQGQIARAFEVEGITPETCRALFLEWVLSHRDHAVGRDEIARLLALHGPQNPHHPMIAVLREGMAGEKPASRRGGWRGRRS